MRVLMVAAAPVESFEADMVASALRGLEGAGHLVDVLDLAGEGFEPVMSADEHRAYETTEPVLDPQVRDHGELVDAAEALVFVYASGWSGVPTIMKGWLERVLVPGVAFTLDSETDRVHPAMTHVRRLVGITTHDVAGWRVRLGGDPGRRTIGRTLRLVCHRRRRPMWLALHGREGAGEGERAEFLATVESKLGDL